MYLCASELLLKINEVVMSKNAIFAWLLPAIKGMLTRTPCLVFLSMGRDDLTVVKNRIYLFAFAHP